MSSDAYLKHAMTIVYSEDVLHLTNIFVLQRAAKGQVLIDKVCEHISLLEKDYFSCSFRDTNNIKV